MPVPVIVDEAETQHGRIFLAATPRGLCRVTIPGESYGDLLTWLERKVPAADVTREDGSLGDSARLINGFFDGEPLPPVEVDLYGTPFQRRVWEAVLAIPYGETRSYAEIARTIGYPLASRAVGAANAVNPLPFIVPCHRVIGADGSIKGFPGGIVTRRMLLELEGALP